MKYKIEKIYYQEYSNSLNSKCNSLKFIFCDRNSVVELDLLLRGYFTKVSSIEIFDLKGESFYNEFPEESFEDIVEEYNLKDIFFYKIREDIFISDDFKSLIENDTEPFNFYSQILIDYKKDKEERKIKRKKERAERVRKIREKEKIEMEEREKERKKRIEEENKKIKERLERIEKEEKERIEKEKRKESIKKEKEKEENKRIEDKIEIKEEMGFEEKREKEFQAEKKRKIRILEKGLQKIREKEEYKKKEDDTEIIRKIKKQRKKEEIDQHLLMLTTVLSERSEKEKRKEEEEKRRREFANYVYEASNWFDSPYCTGNGNGDIDYESDGKSFNSYNSYDKNDIPICRCWGIGM